MCDTIQVGGPKNEEPCHQRSDLAQDYICITSEKGVEAASPLYLKDGLLQVSGVVVADTDWNLAIHDISRPGVDLGLNELTPCQRLYVFAVTAGLSRINDA